MGSRHRFDLDNVPCLVHVVDVPTTGADRRGSSLGWDHLWLGVRHSAWPPFGASAPAVRQPHEPAAPSALTTTCPSCRCRCNGEHRDMAAVGSSQLIGLHPMRATLWLGALACLVSACSPAPAEEKSFPCDE